LQLIQCAIPRRENMSLSTFLQSGFASSDDLATALGKTLNRFRATSGTIHVLDSDGLLHLAASHGISQPALEELRTVPIGKGMVGLAVERRQPVSGMQADASSDERRNAKDTGLERGIAVPIFREDAVVGVLAAGSDKERVFGEPELAELLQAGRALAERLISSNPAPHDGRRFPANVSQIKKERVYRSFFRF